MGLQDILKSPQFNIAFSFILGIGIVAIARPLCKGEACTLFKAPPVKEWDGAVYRIGGDCYEYTTKTIQCPGSGEIEAFKDNFNRRPSIITDRDMQYGCNV